MPIVTDKRKFSFEFFYEFDSEDGQKFTYPIKYLYGPYGPTVQVFLPDGAYVELPADIFGEISNFLVQQGVLPPSNFSPQSAVGGKSLAVPLLKGAMGAVHSRQQKNPFAPQINTNPLAPTSELSNLYPSQEIEVPSLSNEEIMEARQEAKVKANANTKTHFKKGHIENGYNPPSDSPTKRATRAADEIEQK